jgi:putative SOS response-associated peptidase YedK
VCNRYRRAVALGQIEIGFREASETRIPLRFPEGRPNLAATDICITDTGTIIRLSAQEPGSAELVQRRWSWPGPTGKPVFNYRSDGREFPSGRCLIVTDGFYEFTASKDGKGKKDRWLFTMADEPWFCIAGIWRTHPEVGEAFTMLTTEPGPDVAPYHNRQVAVLSSEDWSRWLDPSVPARTLIGPAPAGTLDVSLQA